MNVVICSKSRWEPAIRREHAFSRMAGSQGHAVTFVERPQDVRASTNGNRRAWIRGLRPGMSTRFRPAPGVEVVSRSTIVPGNRGQVAMAADNRLLSQVLRSTRLSVDAVVGYVPWQWPAVHATRATRKVFDCTDNWVTIMPQGSNRLRDLFRRIAGEADEIVVVSSSLQELFPSRAVRVVPNGADDDLLADEVSARPMKNRLTYVGTLSERFDAPLMEAVLAELPACTLDLFGPCQYAGWGESPGPELRSLLDAHAGRATWHGPVDRRNVGRVLDASDVLLIPNRTELSKGQDSMKLYDYASRGRPVVTTPIEVGDSGLPPGTAVVDGANRFAEAILAGIAEDASAALSRQAWAKANAYERRWPAWASAVLGLERDRRHAPVSP